MATSGRKHITIEAPIMKIEGAYVWMDRHWPIKFFDWLNDEKLNTKLYRFSLEWSRLVKRQGGWSSKAVKHYHQVLSCLQKQQITPSRIPL